MTIEQLRAALDEAEQDLRVTSRARGLAENLGQADDFADAEAAMNRAADRFVAARAALKRHAPATI